VAGFRDFFRFAGRKFEAQGAVLLQILAGNVYRRQMRLTAFVALVLSVACGGCDGELADKPAWAALQRVEFDDRSSSLKGTELRRLPEGYVVLAEQGRGEILDGYVAGPQPRRSWIMLNEHTAGKKVKQMGRFSAYVLPCTDVHGLENLKTDTDDYAISYRRSICTR
jgi:hypothetical protein